MLAENPVMSGLNKMADLIVLNLCFLISCLPVFTIGAGVTALYSVNLKMVRNEESYVFRSYWRAFRENFRQATMCWLLLAAVGAVFAWDLRMIPLFPDVVQYVFYAGVVICGVVYVIELLYVFAYLARFRDGLCKSLKNAFLIGGTRVACTGTLLLVTSAFTALGIACLTESILFLFFWLAAGASVMGYVQAWILRSVFDRYEKK